MSSLYSERFSRACERRDCRGIFDSVKEHHERFGVLPYYARHALNALVETRSHEGLFYLKELVRNFECNVNSRSEYFYRCTDTPLHASCRYKLQEYVHCLTSELCCDTTIRNYKNELPLHVAIKSQCGLDIIKMVWPSGSDVDLRTRSGDTPLHLACEIHCALDIIQYFVSTVNCDVNLTNKRSELALHIAIRNGLSFDIIVLLLSEVNKDMQTSEGDTPLHLACASNQKDIVYYLISKMQCSLNIANKKNELALHIAIRNGFCFDTLVLLVNEVNKDIQTSEGNTLLHLACASNEKDIVYYLISKMQCSVNIANKKNELPLHVAFRKGLSFDTLVLLVSDVNKDVQISEGNTLLHLACKLNYEKVTRHLLKLHCNISIANDKGELPLHIFLHYGSDFNLLKLLCSSSNVNTQDNSGNTPLHIACKHIKLGCEHLVLYLIDEMHCDLAICNSSNELPLHIALVSNASVFTVVQLASYCQIKGHIPMQLSQDTVTETVLEYVQSAPKLEPNVMEEQIFKYIFEKHLFSAHFNLDTLCESGRYGLMRRILLYSGLSINPYVRSLSGKLALSNHGNTPLHLACSMHDLELVTFLCKKPTFSDSTNNDGKMPIHIAAASKYQSLEMVKVLDPDNVNQLTTERDTPLNIACRCKNLDLADHLMVERHCSISVAGQLELTGAILNKLYGYGSSWEVSSIVRTGDTLLHLCCRMNCHDLALQLVVEKKFNPNIANNFKEFSLHIACRVLSPVLVKLVSGCNPNALTYKGNTPLHEVCQASSRSPSEAAAIVQYLIEVKQCSTSIVNHEGKTALHLACVYGTPEVVKLLLSIGKAEPNVTDHKNQTPLSVTPLDKHDTINILLQYGADPKPLYSLFGDYLKERKSEHPPDSPLRIIVVGNSSSGKTTLIHSLKCESGCHQEPPEPHTAGIVPTDFKSEVYGAVTWYDFAGEPEYYASHEAILQHIMSASPPVVLLLMNVSKPEEDIEHEILYWLKFIEHQCQLENEKPHLVVIGSHADIVQQQRQDPLTKMNDVLKRIRGNIYQSKLKLINSFVVNCCSLTSSHMNALQGVLKTSAKALGKTVALSFLCHCLYVYLLDRFKTHTAITIGEVMQNIAEPTLDDDIVESENESMDSEEESIYEYESDDAELLDSDPLHLLPTTLPELNALCEELDRRGHIILLKSSENNNGWLILDKGKLLSKIHGSIFAPKQVGDRRHKTLASSTGVVSFGKFKESFPEHDPDMLIQFFTHLEFCTEVEDPEVLKILHQESANSSYEYYFFPGLVELEKPKEVWNQGSQTQYYYSTSWVLEPSEPGEFFTPRFIQLLLLRLAFAFVFPLPYRGRKGCEIVSIKRECLVWKNGLSWLSSNGIETIVEMADQWQVHMMMRSQCEMPQAFARLRSSVIKKVVTTAKELSKFTTAESFIDPKAMEYPCSDCFVYRFTNIAKAVIQKPLFVRSDSNKQLKLREVVCLEPYAELSTDIITELFCRTNLDAFMSAEFLEKLLTSVNECTNENKALLCQILHCTKPSQLKATLKKRKWTYSHLNEELDRHSIFCGRNVMELCGLPDEQTDAPSPAQSEPESPPFSDEEDVFCDALSERVIHPYHVNRLAGFLLSEVAGNWMLFLSEIGVESGEIDCIRSDNANQPSFSKLCLLQGLNHWVRSHDSPTYEKIVQVLKGDVVTNKPLALKVEQFADELFPTN